jgi:hypothetical protein
MSTSSKPIRDAVANIAAVARKTAKQLSPILEVTVLSRNPDGSLNVDDGLGGCQRIAAAANVRIGQKIRLGTEPSIGQQTNLPSVTLSISPSTKPCPTDGRPDCEDLIGAPCPEPKVVEAATVATIGHLSYEVPQVPPNPTDWAWSTRGSQTPTIINSGNVIQAGAGLSKLISPHFANICERGFFEFDTAGALPDGWEYLSAQITFKADRNSVPTGNRQSNQTIYIVESNAADYPITTADWNSLGSEPLASFDIVASIPSAHGGVGPYTDITLDLADSFVPNFAGKTKLGITSYYDLFGVDPETIAGSFTSKTAVVWVGSTEPGIGGPGQPKLLLSIRRLVF